MPSTCEKFPRPNPAKSTITHPAARAFKPSNHRANTDRPEESRHSGDAFCPTRFAHDLSRYVGKNVTPKSPPRVSSLLAQPLPIPGSCPGMDTERGATHPTCYRTVQPGDTRSSTGDDSA